MGSLGIGEIVVIVVFALIVLGPNRLPQAGRQLGRALAEFRRVSTGVRQDLEEALDASELRDTVNELRTVMDPKRMLADTIGPLSDDDKPLSGVMRPAGAAAIPPPDGDVAVAPPSSSAFTSSVPSPTTHPGRDILDDSFGAPSGQDADA